MLAICVTLRVSIHLLWLGSILLKALKRGSSLLLVTISYLIRPCGRGLLGHRRPVVLVCITIGDWAEKRLKVLFTFLGLLIFRLALVVLYVIGVVVLYVIKVSELVFGHEFITLLLDTLSNLNNEALFNLS